MSLYGKIYRLLSGAVKKIYRIRIDGAENEPEQGPFIVCSNHLSFQDVLILAASLHNQMHFLAKAELFKIPLLGRLIRALGAIPLERQRGDVGAIKKSISLLEEGKVVGIYPQGHRYPGVPPSETEPKSGVGLIALRTKATVLPVCIQTKKFKIRIFRRVYVTVGKPIGHEDLGVSETGRAEYDKAAHIIFDSICSMVKNDI